jgi:hypothetical protein
MGKRQRWGHSEPDLGFILEAIEEIKQGKDIDRWIDR